MTSLTTLRLYSPPATSVCLRKRAGDIPGPREAADDGGKDNNAARSGVRKCRGPGWAMLEEIKVRRESDEDLSADAAKSN